MYEAFDIIKSFVLKSIISTFCYLMSSKIISYAILSVIMIIVCFYIRSCRNLVKQRENFIIHQMKK